MKKLLLPTDFSPNAKVALNFAVELAKSIHAEVMVMHSFSSFSKDGIEGESYDMARDRVQKQLDSFTNEYTDVNITSYPMLGDLAANVHTIVTAEKIDFVIMGTKGATSLASTIFGSNALKVVEKVEVPVWVIPENTVFKGLDTILLATDQHFVNNDDAFDPILDLANRFNSHVKITTVRDKDHEVTYEEALEKAREGRLFDGTKWSYRTIINSNPVNGIYSYLDSHKDVDVLAVLARKHGLWDKILGKSHTKELTLYTEIPLLVLHDTE